MMGIGGSVSVVLGLVMRDGGMGSRDWEGGGRGEERG